MIVAQVEKVWVENFGWIILILKTYWVENFGWEILDDEILIRFLLFVFDVTFAHQLPFLSTKTQERHTSTLSCDHIVNLSL